VGGQRGDGSGDAAGSGGGGDVWTLKLHPTTFRKVMRLRDGVCCRTCAHAVQPPGSPADRLECHHTHLRPWHGIEVAETDVCDGHERRVP
jgi:hypothetical protein